MTTDIFYSLHTRENGTLTAEFNMADWANLTRGERATFEFHFPNPSDDLTVDNTTLTVSTSYTISSGEEETHKTVTVESGATLTVDGILNVAELTVNGTLDGSGTVNVVENVVSHTIASGTAEVYDTVTIANNTKLVVDGILQANLIDNNGGLDNNNIVRIASNGDIFDQIRQYDDYGGKYETQEMLDSTVKYKEFRPSNHDVATQVIGIEPSQNLQDRNAPALWGLVDSVDDTRPLALGDTRVQVEITILAEYSEYTDHTALEADLKI